jgi:hypothetical protein
MLYDPSKVKNFELYNDLVQVEKLLRKGWCQGDYQIGDTHCIEGAIMDVDLDGRRRGKVREALYAVLRKRCCYPT